MDDVSYYSDEESVCLGLTFTHSQPKVQSSTHSTDSGVECLNVCDKNLAAEIPNTEHDPVPKCDNDSGCDVKHHENDQDNLDSIYPGLSDGVYPVPPPDISNRCGRHDDAMWGKARALAEKARAKLTRDLGGVEGGKKVPLNTRSLDVLSGKLETSTKFQRGNLRSPDMRKRKCIKNPSNTPVFKSSNDSVIYENVSEITVRKHPEYVNFRPIMYNSRDAVSPSPPSHSASYETSSHSPPTFTPYHAPVGTPQHPHNAILYHAPGRRNYKGRASPEKPYSPAPTHLYEQIKSPAPTATASSSSYYCSTPALSPSPKPRFTKNHGKPKILSTKKQRNGQHHIRDVDASRTLSPGEIPDKSYDERRHQVIGRRHQSPSPRPPGHTYQHLMRARAFTPDLSTDGSIGSYHHAMRSNRMDSMENPLYSTSPSSTPSILPYKQGSRDGSRDTCSPNHHPSYALPPSDWSEDDSESWAYEKTIDQLTEDGEEWCLKCDVKIDSAVGYCTTCTSYSLTSPEPSSYFSDTDKTESKNAGRKVKKQSRFRYSTSNIWSSEKDKNRAVVEEAVKETKRGIVLIQATIDDILSLDKIQDNVFELRFVDSGVTPEMLNLLPDLCRKKDILRVIFEDCELDDWKTFSDVISKTNVAHLGFHACNIGDEGAVSLSQLINQVTTIASLDLVRCRVKCAGVAALGVSLMQNSTLKALNISYNPFQAKGAVLFFRALKGGNTTLQYLNVSNSCCGSTEVVVMLGALLLRDTPLLHINLNNSGVTDDGLALISESIAHNTYLSSLCVAGNHLTDASAHELSVTLADSEHLQHVNISDNQLTVKGISVLIESITVKSSIRRLDVTKNNINPDQYVSLLRTTEDLGISNTVQI